MSRQSGRGLVGFAGSAARRVCSGTVISERVFEEVGCGFEPPKRGYGRVVSTLRFARRSKHRTNRRSDDHSYRNAYPDSETSPNHDADPDGKSHQVHIVHDALPCQAVLLNNRRQIRGCEPLVA